MARVVHFDRTIKRRELATLVAESQLGLLIVDGIVARTIRDGEVIGTELLGRGDVLRPPVRFRFGGTSPRLAWQPLTPLVSVALLDQAFADRVARWPEVTWSIVDRTRERADSLLLQAAFRGARRVDERVHLALLHFAKRFGEEDGNTWILPPVRLTAAMLGRIVGARRQAVSTAMGSLMDSGAIRRRSDGALEIRSRAGSLQPASDRSARASSAPDAGT